MALFVVDVSGHGVASSLLSVTIGRTMTADIEASSLLVRSNADGTVQITEPAEVAAELNRRFPMEDQGDLYFTIVYAILNTKTKVLRYASAGHNPIAMHRRGNRPILLPAAGFAVGWMEDIEYDQHEIQLQSGDRIYLYSDGIPEALDETLTEFDEPRMLELIHRCGDLDLSTTADAIVGAVNQWCRIDGPKDDVSLLVIELD